MPQRYRKRKIEGRTYSEHRLVYEQHHGPIPAGMLVHHQDQSKPVPRVRWGARCR